MLSIFCVNVGTLYGTHYEERLCSMFRRHLQLPFRFICATDKENIIDRRVNGVDYIAPVRDCWGWWNLEEAYSNPSWCEGGQILYTGLDTIITRDITEVIIGCIARDRLTLMRDFEELINNGNAIYRNTYADGVAFIPRGGNPAIWNSFLKYVGPDSRYPMHVFNTKTLREEGIVPELWQDIAPDFLCSYKWPTIKIECPPEAVVCFHGEPRPDEAVKQTPWIAEHWR